MAMNKILYVVPALAILGMLPAADADTVQERIERLQERIAEIQERIEQSTDQKKIAKWEAKIDRLQERIAELEARQTKAPQSATPPQEPASAPQEVDNTPPSVVSAGLSEDLATLTITFDEEVRRASSTSVVFIDGLSSVTLSVSTSATSETFAIGVPAGLRPLIGDNPSLRISDDTFRDTAGNGNARTNMPITIPDTTPPSLVSATLDLNDGTLTVVFDETVKISTVRVGLWLLANAENVTDRQFLGNNQLSTTSDSETITVAPSQAVLDWVGDKSLVLVIGNSISDLAGNSISRVSELPLTVIPADTVPDATVTITARGMFAEDAGTIDLQQGGDMTIEVRFVNGHGSDHTILADLISWNFGHQSEDIALPSGQSETVTFTVQGDAPRIA